jgi:uncharacterized protein with HEPN domain
LSWRQPNQDLITQIAEAAALIANVLKAVSKEAFLNDRFRQDPMIRRIQIIGEAVSFVPLTSEPL